MVQHAALWEPSKGRSLRGSPTPARPRVIQLRIMPPHGCGIRLRPPDNAKYGPASAAGPVRQGLLAVVTSIPEVHPMDSVAMDPKFSDFEP